ncbi:hypothetical protein [Sporosarcina sp. BP05]|uniref:hypothetical protein n=1 Tax=Sporosarcina sp. BP05 TaxID=2758726 RepID=UPI0016454776|nr:hypothetical protein [Sporosarcina sp. BP05]
MFDVLQAILIIIGAVFIVIGIVNVAKAYNIDKILSIFINMKKQKTNKEKGKL